MEFASEMIIKAELNKLKIAEVPIVLHKDGRSRKPHLRSFRDGWRHLRFMLLYSPRWLFLMPGLFLFLAGLFLGSILLTGPVMIGQIGLDTNTLLVCAMSMLVGFQLVSFATYSKIYAISHGLLPQDPKIDMLFHKFRLENGIILGSIITFLGMLLMGVGAYYWERHGFGVISYPKSLRIVIPAVTLVTLGINVIFSSFFLSILGLRRK
jgi:hypothetical protein